MCLDYRYCANCHLEGLSLMIFSCLLQDKEPTSFYALFDGHGGIHAAYYCVAHFHQFLAQNIKYPSDMIEALRETFLKVDASYVDKCEAHVRCSRSIIFCCRSTTSILPGKKILIHVSLFSRTYQVDQQHYVLCIDQRRRSCTLGG